MSLYKDQVQPLTGPALPDEGPQIGSKLFETYTDLLLFINHF